MTAAVKIPKHPLAFGMWEWGPLPGTTGAIMWNGAGERLYFCLTTDRCPQGTRRPIEHPTANGTYASVKQADAAVQAFAAEYARQEAEDQT